MLSSILSSPIFWVVEFRISFSYFSHSAHCLRAYLRGFYRLTRLTEAWNCVHQSIALTTPARAKAINAQRNWWTLHTWIVLIPSLGRGRPSGSRTTLFSLRSVKFTLLMWTNFREGPRGFSCCRHLLCVLVPWCIVPWFIVPWFTGSLVGSGTVGTCHRGATVDHLP